MQMRRRTPRYTPRDAARECLPTGVRRIRRLNKTTLLAVALVAAACGQPRPDDVRVAVAANFLSTLRTLQSEFERESGERLVVTSGSTGLLYAQIRNGAPFDLLLSADQERPRLLAAEGYGDARDVFTYAIGQLALWSNVPGRIDDTSLDALDAGEFRWIAIAEPEVAPYGKAAMQALERIGIWDALSARIVRGQNVAQALAMVETGNADVGFIALSQALAYDGESSYAIVPASLHEPIRQDAIVLHGGLANKAVGDFVEFLRSPRAARILEQGGYALPVTTR
jgi:molybdate transport system substrate-binding protein